MKSLGMGAIAGFVSGTLAFVLTVINTNIISFPYPYSSASFIPILNVATNEIVLGTIWGIIFGIFYSIFYDSIPGQSVSKGVVYGMVVFLFSRIRWVPYTIAYEITHYTISATFIGFFAFLSYGLVLGYIYKK